MALLLAVIVGINKCVNRGPEKELRDFSQIEESGILNVVTDYNLITYYASGDSVAGFIKDLLKAFASEKKLKLNVTVENSLDRCIEGLDSGRYDLIARHIPVNNRLRERISFTQAVIRNKLVLVQRVPIDGSEKRLIRNHLDLANETIYVPRSSPAILRLQNLAHEIGDTIFIREDSLYETPQLVMKVAAGEISYTVSDALAARNLLKMNPEIDINTDIGFSHLEAWAVRNSSPVLLDSLNAWLSRFQQTDDYRKIFESYYK